jgi:hypothetical protein
MTLLHSLSPVGFASPLVFPREEIDLYFDRISADADGSMKDEGLPLILLVAACQE